MAATEAGRSAFLLGSVGSKGSGPHQIRQEGATIKLLF